MKLEDFKSQMLVDGIIPGKTVKIISVEQNSADTITIYYKQDDGKLSERQLFRADEEKYSPAVKHFTFNGNADDFKLALEAKRISNAHLFDPFMAVHSSNVIPLPHQITAVYESMLPKQPLRYILADDPGAGKTIMAGLLIRELMARADIERILIVSPGSLVEQWQDELSEKFNLQFNILSREIEQQCRGNVFEEYNCLIARIDQLKRMEYNEEMQEKEKGDLWKKLELVNWDLVIIDEAHKLSASQSGEDIHKSQRFRLGETLSARSKHFLMMTATPHNGKEEDFQIFLSLIDNDRFGRVRGDVGEFDVSDIMRRMCKEELVKFDGTPLFPQRKAISVTYQLSDREMALYEHVTQYVIEEMNKAERLDNNKKGNVGFALTNLQRRLASSPEAIYTSLKNRKFRLTEKLKEWKKTGITTSSIMTAVGERTHTYLIMQQDDSLTPEEYERVENEMTDTLTASRSIEELKKEIETLSNLEREAEDLVFSKQDKKWEELRSLLDDPQMKNEAGARHKLIIFTEYKATLDYLQDRISNSLGDTKKVVVIHGGLNRDKRREIQEEFRHNPDVQILIATDAAGEGVNLQNAHLMINYDLPWNPNRIEQRFGRIHRIGQTEVCYLWNLIANETREGAVFAQLFEKLEKEREALGGKVFDILGDLFEDKPLQELLIEAIRYGEDPLRKEELKRVVEGALDREHIDELIRRNALTHDCMSPERMFAVREEMEKAEAKKLQPYFVKSYFQKAFENLGGTFRPRETGRFEITYVPESVRSMDRKLIGNGRVNQNPVVSKYERVCFERDFVDVKGKPAALLHPGHPLMAAVTGCILDKYEGVLKQGSVFVNPADEGLSPQVLCVLDHKISDGEGKTLSRVYQFVLIDRDGNGKDAGFAPHLDLRALDSKEVSVLEKLAGSSWSNNISSLGVDGADLSWLNEDIEERALAFANARLVPKHFNETKVRHEADIDKQMSAVNIRLTKEIDYLTQLRTKFEANAAKGKPAAIPSLEKTKQDIRRISDRLDAKRKELNVEREVVSEPPKLVAACLILPIGFINRLCGTDVLITSFSEDEKARAFLEKCGMDAVIAKEREMGFETKDVSRENCGWDITSIKYNAKREVVAERHVEVKGKSVSSPVVTVSSNEIRAGLNQQDKYVLAIVIVDGEKVSHPYYVHKPFVKEPDWETVSVNLDVKKLLDKSVEF